MAIDRQGLRCVTVGDDGVVRVWCLADGRCEQVLEGHGAPGACLFVFHHKEHHTVYTV